MMLARLGDALVEATPDEARRAECPTCDAEVIAKTGDQVAWHWAHRSVRDCDAWSESETLWHHSWKRAARALGARLEVPMRGPDGQLHRADIVLPSGVVVEVQHSRLAPEALREREQFYSRRGGVRWVFDAPALGWTEDMRDRSQGAYGSLPAWLTERYHGNTRGLMGRYGKPPRMLAAVRAPMAWDMTADPTKAEHDVVWASRPYFVRMWSEWLTRLRPAPDVLTSTWALGGASEPVACDVDGCRGAGRFFLQTTRRTFWYCPAHVEQYRADCAAGAPAERRAA